MYDSQNYEAFVESRSYTHHLVTRYSCQYSVLNGGTWICGNCGVGTFPAATAQDGDICHKCKGEIVFLKLAPKTPIRCIFCGAPLPCQCQKYSSRRQPGFYGQPFYSAQNASSSPSGGGTNKVASGSIKIWWDNSIGAYMMVTPYNKSFVDALKMLAPASDRIWDADKKTWMISEKIVLLVKDLAEKSFHTTATFISKAQAQNASAPPRASQSSPLDKLMLDFLKLLPYNAARKAYQVAAMELHPDKGGSLEKMTQLNAAWSRIEKEHFKVGAE